ncbi:hypothetical protein [Leisingera sp. McT4-56]|uniref:hypothetical protein n=1 Tax=Leisingera sp. McT4-56 TaxID=2881255 RepID=UPI001CF8A112|nr:hypothetical protein [Leisingera sp. McT4-56]MCB4456669.1 hypothetical protein [Leisingera sp. McT4-56]
MRVLVSLLLSVAAAPSSAQDGLIAGRITCLADGSHYVASDGSQSGMKNGRSSSLPAEASLIFEYVLDHSGRLEVFFREENRESVYFEDPFLAQGFKGFSPFTDVAEFRSNYREFSFARHHINYSGNDQLFLKKCSGADWRGHYVQTFVGGRHTQVTNLLCQTEVDAVDEVLARLRGMN